MFSMSFENHLSKFGILDLTAKCYVWEVAL